MNNLLWVLFGRFAPCAIFAEEEDVVMIGLRPLMADVGIAAEAAEATKAVFTGEFEVEASVVVVAAVVTAVVKDVVSAPLALCEVLFLLQFAASEDDLILSALIMALPTLIWTSFFSWLFLLCPADRFMLFSLVSPPLLGSLCAVGVMSLLDILEVIE